MHLIINETIGSYYYVHDDDHSIRLSPSFDYIEDAEQWHERIMSIMTDLAKEDYKPRIE
jgi:hypothetical protein